MVLGAGGDGAGAAADEAAGAAAEGTGAALFWCTTWLAALLSRAASKMMRTSPAPVTAIKVARTGCLRGHRSFLWGAGGIDGGVLIVGVDILPPLYTLRSRLCADWDEGRRPQQARPNVPCRSRIQTKPNLTCYGTRRGLAPAPGWPPAKIPGERGGHNTVSRACSNRVGGVRQPAWWPYPERCQNGHEWGPGRVLVTWQQCSCPGAQTLHPDRAIWGHFTVACRAPGCRSVWLDPPHRP
jgi:hypothetical protein